MEVPTPQSPIDAPFADLTLGDFLAKVGDRTPAPGGGACAAIALALAAGLVGMAARFSSNHIEGVDAMAAKADRLRVQAADLADADAAAYRSVLAALRQPGRNDTGGSLKSTFTEAVRVPLAIAEGGAQLAAMAESLLLLGNRNLKGDVLAALSLAQAATHSAEDLVRINVDQGALDRGLMDRARDLSSIVDGVVNRTKPQD